MRKDIVFSYYNYSPRLRLYQCLIDCYEPQTNDIIQLHTNWFSEIGKPFRESEHISMYIPIEFRVKEKMIYYWASTGNVTITFKLELIDKAYLEIINKIVL